MYYSYQWSSVFVIRKEGDKDFIFGPFESESDCQMITEMLNMKNLHFSGDDIHGKEDFKDTDPVHKHAAE